MPYIGDGRLDAVQPFGPMTLADDTGACLFLQFMPRSVRGEKQTVQRTGATIAIDADGATGSKLQITLKVKRQDFTGTALTDLTYVISGAAAKDDSDWASAGTADAADLKDVIDLINELENFKAWAGDAPHAMSVNSGNFIDLAATYINPGTSVSPYTKVLHRDVSEFTDANSDKVAWMRVSLPEVRDRNALRIIDIVGKATGATNGVVKLYRDEYELYGTDQEVYEEHTLAAALTSYVSATIENANTVRGPLILEVRSDDLTAAEYRVKLIQASLKA